MIYLGALLTFSYHAFLIQLIQLITCVIFTLVTLFSVKTLRLYKVVGSYNIFFGIMDPSFVHAANSVSLRSEN